MNCSCVGFKYFKQILSKFYQCVQDKWLEFLYSKIYQLLPFLSSSMKWFYKWISPWPRCTDAQANGLDLSVQMLRQMALIWVYRCSRWWPWSEWTDAQDDGLDHSEHCLGWWTWSEWTDAQADGLDHSEHCLSWWPWSQWTDALADGLDQSEQMLRMMALITVNIV